MTIAFDAHRWETIRRDYTAWWDGKLARPLYPVWLWGRDPGRPCPPAPYLTQETCADFRWSPEELIDRIDYEISRYEFMADAYPVFTMDCFGPGVAAAMLGATLDNSTGSVWFHPPRLAHIRDLHFSFDPSNRWFQRLMAIYKAAIERWQGEVLMGITDLGGTLDVLSTFLPAEQLLLDLVDHPAEVERLTWEIHECWFAIYDAFSNVLKPANPGWSNWSAIYSAEPSFMLQCDFSYMIGPQMFRRFVLPELSASCRRLSRAMYHLDGIGELPHLPMLLEIPELAGIQWVPGDGKPDCSHWPEVYRTVHEAGKLIQVVTGGTAPMRAIRSQIGTLKNVLSRGEYAPLSERSRLEDELHELGVI